MGMGLGGSAVWGFPLFRVPGEIAESTHDVLERWGLGTMGGRRVQNFIMEFLEMFLEFLTCNTNSPKPIFFQGVCWWWSHENRALCLFQVSPKTIIWFYSLPIWTNILPAMNFVIGTLLLFGIMSLAMSLVYKSRSRLSSEWRQLGGFTWPFPAKSDFHPPSSFPYRLQTSRP